MPASFATDSSNARCASIGSNGLIGRGRTCSVCVVAVWSPALFMHLRPAVADADVMSSVGVGSAATADGGASFFGILLAGAEWPGLLILLMSVVAVAIALQQIYRVRLAVIVPPAEVDETRRLIEARDFKGCLALVSQSRTMFADVLTAGLRHGRHGFEAMHEAATERANAWSSRLFRQVEYLNIIGNLAPLMGLLGTVLGMIRAFSALHDVQGAARPEDLAGGISLALVNTFLGLAVAIVSLGFFGVCRNRVDALTIAAQSAVVQALEYFRPSVVGPLSNVSVPSTQNLGPASPAVSPARREPTRANTSV